MSGYLISRRNADGTAELLTEREPIAGLQLARDVAADQGAHGGKTTPAHEHAVEAWAETTEDESVIYEIFRAEPGHALCCGIDWTV